MPRLDCICTAEIKWLAACAALILGEYCAFKCQHISAFWPLALFAAVLCVLFGYGLQIRAWQWGALALLGFAIAAIGIERRRSVLADAHIHGAGQPFRAVMTLRADAIVKPSKKGTPIAEFSGEIRSLRLKVIAELPPGTAPPLEGETWECCGWLSALNENDTTMRRNLWVRGARAHIRRLSGNSGTLGGMLRNLKLDFARRLSIGACETNGDDAKLVCAMLLGERHLMTRDERKIFVDSGAMHVFAISGLHVMVLARIFVLASVMTLLPLRFAGFTVIPLMWIYVLMVGAPPSAVRAAAMASICLVAPMFWRRPNGIVAWAMAFFAAHLADPAQIVNPGSTLSFAVMLALVILLRFGEGLLARPVLGTIMISSVAWAAGMPICARFFGRIALSGLVSGPLVMPCAMAATICAAIGVILSFVSEHMAAYANACAGLLMRLMSAIATLAAHLPGGTINVGTWSLAECAAWYMAMIGTFWLVISVSRREKTTV